jgi:hypothetical protein
MKFTASLDRIFDRLHDVCVKLDGDPHSTQWWFHIQPDPSNPGQEMIAEDLFGGLIEIRAHDAPGIGRYSRRTTYSVCIISGAGWHHDDPAPDVTESTGLTQHDALHLALTHLMGLRITSTLLKD